MIDPMNEPRIVSIRGKLEAQATPVWAAFEAARYGAGPLLFGMWHDPEDCEMSIPIYSHTGSGGMQDALIQFNGKDECSIFVGPIYDAPRPEDRPVFSQAGLIPPMTRKKVLPSSSPDLVAVLLREVRRLMLEDEGDGDGPCE